MLAASAATETDEGRNAARRAAERLCLATRMVRPAAELIRYVVDPNGRIVPDLAHKLPGRGAWVTGTRLALDTALTHNAFARAFRGKGVADRDLGDLVERLLEQSALEALSLANKAGQVLCGFGKVEAAARGGRIAALISASDAGADGTRKLTGAIAQAAREAGEKPARIAIFSSEQLDLALGRANVVHAALLPHPASRGFLARCVKLERWRTGGLGGATTAVGQRSNLSSVEHE